MDASTDVLQVVGIGADGWAGLAPGARALVESAEVLLGGRRHLDLVPETPATREPWPAPLVPALPSMIERYAGRRVVVLASGDPLVSGIGSTLVDLLGPERVEVHPAVSSVSLAHARLGWSAESTDVVTLVGRDADLLRRWLSPGRRLVVLSSGAATPALVAALLVDAGFGSSRLAVLSDLGSDSESSRVSTASAWGETSAPALNVLCVLVVADPSTRVLACGPGLPDDAFEHDGQLTKRDLRALALSRLAPNAGELLWDVGAGAGSVGIEWLRSDPRCRAVAVEMSAERAERIGRNAARLGVPTLEVRTGEAPDALIDLRVPDAVFVGGGATAPGVLDTIWDRLRPGGRLVAHAVTFETEAVLLEWRERVGGELVRVSVEHAEPLGSFTGWRPARAVVQWAAQKQGRR